MLAPLIKKRKMKDITIDETGDLEFSNGDFKTNISDEQSAILIVETHLGSWRINPLVGVGISEYLGSSGLEQELRRKILLQMQTDGFTDCEVDLVTNINGLVDYNLTANRL